MTMNDEAAIRVTDGLGHDLLTTTESYARQMVAWLDLEDDLGEPLSEDLRDLRDRLRAQLADAS